MISIKFSRKCKLVHYVYRLTARAPVEGKIYYVGKHSGELDDLSTGVYKTSSKIVKEIFSNETFRIKIVKIFDNAIDAVKFEAKYHARVNAKHNPLFFNNANQSYPVNNPFDRGGLVTAFDSEAKKNVTISTLEYRNNRERFKSPSEGVVSCKNKITGETMRVSKEVFDNSPDLVGVNFGITHTRTKSGDKISVSKEYYKENKDKFKSPHEGLTQAYDIKSDRFVKVSRDEFFNNPDLKGANFKSGVTSKKVKCEICGREIQAPNLKNHLITHGIGEEKYFARVKCSECGKEFKNYRALQSHKQFHSQLETVKCEICGKEVAKIALAGHKVTHIKKVKCEICGGLFNPRHIGKHLKVCKS